MELFSVGIKEYYYEVFYRDIERFEADLKNVPAFLYTWRVGELDLIKRNEIGLP